MFCCDVSLILVIIYVRIYALIFSVVHLSLSLSLSLSLTHTYTLCPPQERLVKLLLDAGANIDAQSCNGGTPLMRAIETSQKTIIKLLLERGYVRMYMYIHVGAHQTWYIKQPLAYCMCGTNVTVLYHY